MAALHTEGTSPSPTLIYEQGLRINSHLSFRAALPLASSPRSPGLPIPFYFFLLIPYFPISPESP